jgi:hypothetical protein
MCNLTYLYKVERNKTQMVIIIINNNNIQM